MKPSFKLRHVAMALATAALCLSAGAAGAETWRFATKMPPDSPEGKVYQYFADKAAEFSKGGMSVKVYPSEQLGKEAAVLEQLQLGTIQLYADDAFFLQKWVPDIKWTSPPFMFQDRAAWQRFIKSDYVARWFRQVDEKVGIRPLGDPSAAVRGPYRVLISRAPITSVKDIQGLKLRMYPDQLAIAVWSHLGADLRMLGWTETYEGLKSGIAGAVTSPAALVESMRFYEVAPNILRTNEFWQGLFFSMNGKAFDRLSRDNQDALLKAQASAAEYSQVLMAQAADKMRADLEAKGVKFSDMDLAPLFEKMAAWYAAEDAAGRLPAGLMDAVKAARSSGGAAGQ